MVSSGGAHLFLVTKEWNVASQPDTHLVLKQPFTREELSLKRKTVLSEATWGMELAQRRAEVHALVDCHGCPYITQLCGKPPEDFSHFTMEFLRGGDAFDYAFQSGKALSRQETQVLGWRTALALRWMHNKGWAHLDVSLENIFLPKPSSVNGCKLGDMGFATKITKGELVNCNCGKGGYKAPEMCKFTYFDGTVDPFDPIKADVYSLAVVIWICLTHKMPGGLQRYIKKYVDMYEVKCGRKSAAKFAITRFCTKHEIIQPDKDALDLLGQMMQPDWSKRIGLAQVMQHSFFTGIAFRTQALSSPTN